MNSRCIIFLRPALSKILALMLVFGLAACQNLAGWLDFGGGRHTVRPIPIASDRFRLVPILPGDPAIAEILASAPVVENTIPWGVNYTAQLTSSADSFTP